MSAPAAFTALERCDRCGAQAYVEVELPVTGCDLLFCSHHAEEHLPKMPAGAVITRDERELLHH